MTAKLYRLQELAAADEASFLENVLTPTSNAYDFNIPFLSATCTLDQPLESDQTVQARKNVSRPGFLGLRTATLEFTTYWPGLTTDPAASTAAASWWNILMGYGLGSTTHGDDGGTISSATDADTFVTTGATTITPGTIIRVGIKGDGRADGQPGVVDTWSAGSTQLLTALPGTPASPDAVRVTNIAYPTETNPATTTRFRFSLMETGAQFHLLGCQLESVTFNIDIAGAAPVQTTWRYRCAYWARGAVTMPSGTAIENTDTAVIAGGSFFFQTFGTTTRSLQECGSLDLTLAMGLIPQQGPRASQEPYGNITGWVSTGCVPTLTWTAPYSTTPETLFDTDGTAATFKHALFVANSTAGRNQGFYCPRMYPVGNRPSYTDRNGLVYVSQSWRGTESTTTTSDLTRSVVRFWQG